MTKIYLLSYWVKGVGNFRQGVPQNRSGTKAYLQLHLELRHAICQNPNFWMTAFSTSIKVFSSIREI